MKSAEQAGLAAAAEDVEHADDAIFLGLQEAWMRNLESGLADDESTAIGLILNSARAAQHNDALTKWSTGG